MTDAAQRPNLLVIMVDQLQADRMKMYGGKDLLTPNLDRLAADGTLFRQAFTTHPLCTPSRQSWWTGQYTHSTRSVFNGVRLDDDVAHLPGLLKEAGYTVALVGKDHCWHAGQQNELFDFVWQAGHGGAEGGKDDPHVQAYEKAASEEFLRLAHGQIVDLPGRVTTTGRATDQALQWLADRREEPFCLWLSYPEPHSPFITTREYAELYDPDKLTLPSSWGGGRETVEDKPAHLQELYDLMMCERLTEKDIRFLTQIYYGMISQIDEGVGKVVSLLEEKGLRGNTIIVFVSDHGEYIGNLGMCQKSCNLPDALIRVPLILSWPGHVPEGQVFDELVEHHDMMPTLCTLMGLAIPDGVQGVDLTGALKGGLYKRDAVYSEIGFHADPAEVREKTYCDELSWPEARGFFHFVFGHYSHPCKGVRTKTHKLVVYKTGERELYDLVSDPEEMTNLAGNPEMAAVEQELTNKLLHWAIASENPLPNLMPRYGEFGRNMRNQLENAFSAMADPWQ